MEKIKVKGKSKSIHTVGNQEDFSPPKNRNVEHPHMDCREVELIYRIDNRLVKLGKWWKLKFRFPCPIDSDTHELFQCEAFLAIFLKD